MSNEVRQPSIMWAQRADKVFITILLTDYTKEVINIEETEQKLLFTCHGKTEAGKDCSYKLDLKLFGEIQMANSAWHCGRQIVL